MIVITSIIAGLAIWMLFWAFIQYKFEVKPENPVYHYKYQRHPFDDFQYFSIRAENRELANEKALQYMEHLSLTRVTVMDFCVPIN